MVIGLDMGISSTKVIAIDCKNNILKHDIWNTGFSDKQLKTFISEVLLYNEDIEHIAITGVGSKAVHGSLMGYPIVKVDEFDANAASVAYVCDENDVIVASMGSGTSFVHIKNGIAKHIGGSALGGGTIIGLFRHFEKSADWPQLISLAKEGSLDKIELTVGDVCDGELPGLPANISVSNFGKTDAATSLSDIALGLINMVLQNIGIMACMAGSGRGIKTIVVIGRTATLPYADQILSQLMTLHGVRFIIPEHMEYMTAIGAAIK